MLPMDMAQSSYDGIVIHMYSGFMVDILFSYHVTYIRTVKHGIVYELAGCHWQSLGCCTGRLAY